MNIPEAPAIPPESGGEERELCRNCLAPNDPGAPFCAKCGAPLSSYAATGPFESLFAEGHVYRQAVERPKSAVVLIGMWMIFGIVGLLGLALLLTGAVAERIAGLVLLLISTAVLWRMTRNYFRERAQSSSASEPGESGTRDRGEPPPGERG